MNSKRFIIRIRYGLRVCFQDLRAFQFAHIPTYKVPYNENLNATFTNAGCSMQACTVLRSM